MARRIRLPEAPGDVVRRGAALDGGVCARIGVPAVSVLATAGVIDLLRTAAILMSLLDLIGLPYPAQCAIGDLTRSGDDNVSGCGDLPDGRCRQTCTVEE